MAGEIKMVSAVCPHCGAQLEVNSNLEKAFCQYCGTQYFVANAVTNHNIYNTTNHTTVNQSNSVKVGRKGTVEAVLDFVENKKQQEEEKRRRIEEEERIQREKRHAFIKKHWKVLLSNLSGFIISIKILNTIGAEGFVPFLISFIISTALFFFILYVIAQKVNTYKASDNKAQLAKEDFEKTSAFIKRYWKILLPVVGILLIAIIIFCLWNQPDKQKPSTSSSIAETQSTTEIIEVFCPISSNEWDGLKYLELVSQFKDAGFTNIKTEAMDDLLNADMDKEYIIASISIDGTDEFSKESVYSPDTEVMITYHSANEIASPLSSEDILYDNYETIVKQFEDAGFTNVQTVRIDDLITGWLTSDGEVQEVLIDGSAEFFEGDHYIADVEIVISYHTFPETTAEESETEPAVEILNSENCPELAAILSTKDTFDPIIGEFARNYSSRTIEFDGHTAYVNPHGDYTTRFDYLIYACDYSESNVSGPSFQFRDVTYNDLNLTGDDVPDTFGMGINVHIVAKVGEYNETTGLFQLKPVSITMR
jgi:DNA-directed RNA polymerase subunit RPC12/RpoP